MKDRYRKLRDKVRQVFEEVAGDRSANLFPESMVPSRGVIASALTEQYGPELALDIAWHLVDWSEEGAFLLALQLAPERFTTLDIQTGVAMFLCDAPSHIAAAAKLSGDPILDIWDLGPLVDDGS